MTGTIDILSVGASLPALLTRRALRRLADAGSYERGADYAARGRVQRLGHDGDLVVAEVVGARRYRVRLWAEGGEVAHACTCPVGEQGLFCKHCVAVAMAWIGNRSGPAGVPALEPADLRAHLAAQSKEALVELLMEQAAADERLRRRLLLDAAGG